MKALEVGGAVAAAACLLASGCREPTEVTVEVTSDEPCDVVATGGTSITTGTLGVIETKVPVTRTFACKDGGGVSWVGTLVLVPGAADEEVGLRVVLGVNRVSEACDSPAGGGPPDYTGCIVARRALRYVPHTPLRLPIVMRGICEGVVCPPDQTCVAGVCAPATIPDPNLCVGTQGCGEGTLVDAGATIAEGGADAGGSTDGAVADALVVDGGSAEGGPSDGGVGPCNCMPTQICCTISHACVSSGCPQCCFVP